MQSPDHDDRQQSTAESDEENVSGSSTNKTGD